jgi:hypothetical protein
MQNTHVNIECNVILSRIFFLKQPRLSETPAVGREILFEGPAPIMAE